MFMFLLGLFLGNVIEWGAHKYILHKIGKNKGSFWSFHFHEHHQSARKSGFRDADYERSWFRWNAQGKEIAALVVSSLTLLPLLYWAPLFVLALYLSALNYYRVHKRSHLDPEWAKKKVPWHYDHHMGPNQDANWCVTFPLMDHLMGTREKYLGTERYQGDERRRQERSSVASRIARRQT